ncbi:MAG: D-glycerate dehydrogenase [Thermoprotei archaeon]|nr:MAG: D-glycerate dehydrogenase [Thermoprotei archaeon]RLF01288.1 MAG: D-glycerate dehydrogenase [Thermoprotei archaeon]
MGKPKVYITRQLPQKAIDMIKEYYDIVGIWEEYYPPPYEVLLEKVKDIDALVSLLTDKIDKNLIDNAPRLRIIAQYAVGYDNIDVEYATQKGIYVTNTPGVLTEAVADLTWALILSVARRIVEADQFVKGGEWWRTKTGWHPMMMLGMEVNGKTLGILGMGRIGRAVARRAKGFNMRIIYYDKYRLSEDLEKELGAEFVDFETLLKESDILSIHVPLTKETYHLIGENELKKMKKGAILINTARGAVIDTRALIKALEEGWIAGAGLDVFEQEPLPPDSPLTKFKNVVLLPHIGSATTETRTRMGELVAENLIAFLKGETPPTLVNKEVLKIRKPGFD